MFQVSLGILAGQHPFMRDACGTPVTWMGTYRGEPGLLWSGPQGRFHVVPTLSGAWSTTGAPREVVRAVDETVDAMFESAEDALAAAPPGREGNVVARQWFYMQRALSEPEFVRQYLEFVDASRRAEALEGLFGP